MPVLTVLRHREHVTSWAGVKVSLEEGLLDPEDAESREVSLEVSEVSCKGTGFGLIW